MAHLLTVKGRDGLVGQDIGQEENVDSTVPNVSMPADPSQAVAATHPGDGWASARANQPPTTA